MTTTATAITPDDLAGWQRLCRFAQLVSQLDEESRANVAAAMDGPPRRYPTQRIAQVVSRRAGERVSAATTGRHRDRTCCCPWDIAERDR